MVNILIDYGIEFHDVIDGQHRIYVAGLMKSIEMPEIPSVGMKIQLSLSENSSLVATIDGNRRNSIVEYQGLDAVFWGMCKVEAVSYMTSDNSYVVTTGQTPNSWTEYKSCVLTLKYLFGFELLYSEGIDLMLN